MQRTIFDVERTFLRCVANGPSMSSGRSSMRSERSSMRSERSSMRSERSSMRSEESSMRSERSSMRSEESSMRSEESSMRSEESGLPGLEYRQNDQKRGITRPSVALAAASEAVKKSNVAQIVILKLPEPLSARSERHAAEDAEGSQNTQTGAEAQQGFVHPDLLDLRLRGNRLDG